MKQVFFRRGEVVVDEVPPPSTEAGRVLVRTAYSCLSPGTELSGVKASGRPLWQRALREPHQVGRVLGMLAEKGAGEALRAVRERADAAHPTGYSAAGTVIAIGEGVADLRAGDRVACAGAQSAFHAEIISVPRNLCAPVPADLPLDAACTVTLGAIALQGVRRLQPTLGETFAVIGLGALGHLAVQLLRANGCRVAAIDLDAARVALAVEAGADWGLRGSDATLHEDILRATAGHGVDGVLITAAGSSDEILSLAFRLCRKKGRVVLVGDVGLSIQRADIYEKELDFLVSSSYGPGRYDRSYEEDGHDYPIGYVRWTENRNMAEYLALLASGRVRAERLTGKRVPMDSAPAAYAALADAEERPLALVLEYAAGQGEPARKVSLRAAAAPAGRLRLALVGTGSFMHAAHVPALRALADRFAIQAVVGRTGHKAKALAQSMGAAYATTDFDQALADESVDAVLIATRHDRHAELALKALAAGKHVLVEKPLALDAAGLASLQDFFRARGEEAGPVLLTGFNRRFSPHARALRELLQGAGGAAVISYRMNAGALPADHWVFGPEGGGRNLGEACHIYDLLTYLTGARVQSIKASAASPKGGYYRADDNFAAVLGFADGSVASFLYTAMGDPGSPKEQMEAYFHGRVARLDDFRRLDCAPGDAPLLQTSGVEKGLKEELEAFHAAAAGRTAWPIPLWQQVQATEIALEVDKQIHGA